MLFKSTDRANAPEGLYTILEIVELTFFTRGGCFVNSFAAKELGALFLRSKKQRLALLCKSYH